MRREGKGGDTQGESSVKDIPTPVDEPPLPPGPGANPPYAVGHTAGGWMRTRARVSGIVGKGGGCVGMPGSRSAGRLTRRMAVCAS